MVKDLLILNMKLSKFAIVLLVLLFIFPSTALPDQFKVIRVLDGDTIIINNGERVRLIGVDTTEKSHPLQPIEFFSEEATKFTRILLEGKEIRLAFDKEKRGKYGRLLAYVFLLDGTFVNAEIIKQGYGFAYTKYPFKYKDKFVAFEKEAQNNSRGYWKYNGKGELDWIIDKGQHPFEVFQMSQKLWGIRYKDFIKARLNDEQLVDSLRNIRRWINEFHDEDLNKQLLKSGWERWGDK